MTEWHYIHHGTAVPLPVETETDSILKVRRPPGDCPWGYLKWVKKSDANLYPSWLSAMREILRRTKGQMEYHRTTAAELQLRVGELLEQIQQHGVSRDTDDPSENGASSKMQDGS